ncbi:MAG: protein translocase subunit SecD [bacterium]|nr:protein translocase subunit SecD [bacterium]
MITKKRTYWIVFFLLLAGIVAGFYDAAEYIPFAFPLKESFKSRPFHLGLDLVGGTHLVYEADTKAIPSSDRGDALEGVRDVIERRVNSLGVTEPVIQTTRVGDTWRVVAELAGVKEVKEAIRLIGETPILEFKELNTDTPPPLDPEQKKKIQENNLKAKNGATETLVTLKIGKTDFLAIAKEKSEDTESKDKGGDIGFVRSDTSGKEALFAAAQKVGVGRLVPTVVETDAGYSIVRVEEAGSDAEAQARHVLICYKGASQCEKETSKEDAKKQIDDLKKQATPENFVELAKKNSTEPGADTRGGDLGWFARGRMVKAFEDAVFPMKKGAISDVIETEFGYHIILKTDERSVPTLRLRQIFFKKTQESDVRPEPDQWKNTALSGKQLTRAQLEFDPNTSSPIIGIEFNDEGAKLFEEITGRNIDKPVAIFLDKNPISIPRVQQKITGGRAVITGQFTIDEAQLLARRLNAGALPVPITLISQATIGPTLGQISLLASLKAGLVALLLVALFMIVFYRLPGILAVVALCFYTIFLLALFRLIPVTMTLSGIAGFVLSLGMAVDANILIFERMREELRSGKPILSSIDEAFKRAWPSIRDGNFTTLIACVILFWFSASLIRGFALVLGLGVLMSMFSALMITRHLLRSIASNRIPHWLL